MLGLQPRETMITRAKAYSEQFWQTMLLFRKLCCKDGGGLPYETFRLFVTGRPEMDGQRWVNGTCMELNLLFSMVRPESLGMEHARQGDVWEVKIEEIFVYSRMVKVTPIRLVGRDAM